MISDSIVFVIKKFLTASKKKYLQLSAGKPENFLRVRRGFEKLTTKFNLKNADFDYKAIHIDGLEVELISPKGKHLSSVLVYFPGGGYHFGSIKSARAIATLLSSQSGTSALVVDYRKSPEFKYPAPIEDAAKAYEYLRHEMKIPPENICFAGDSAGGGVAVGSLLYLRDHNIPLPSCAVLISPWVDHTGTSSSFLSKDEVDPMLPGSRMHLYSKSYLGDAPLDSIYASPIFHNLHGLPPMKIQVGDDEVLRDDSVHLAARAKQDGVSIELEIFPKHFHVFNLFFKVLPSARKANLAMADFIKRHIKR